MVIEVSFRLNWIFSITVLPWFCACLQQYSVYSLIWPLISLESNTHRLTLMEEMQSEIEGRRREGKGSCCLSPFYFGQRNSFSLCLWFFSSQQPCRCLVVSGGKSCARVTYKCGETCNQLEGGWGRGGLLVLAKVDQK